MTFLSEHLHRVYYGRSASGVRRREVLVAGTAVDYRLLTTFPVERADARPIFRLAS